MNTFQSLACAGVLALVAVAASAQSALNENTANRIIDEGQECSSGLDAAKIRPFLNPSTAVKSVLALGATKVRDSEEMRMLAEPERKLVLELINTSKACKIYLDALSAMAKEISDKAAEIKADPKAMQLYGKMTETQKRATAAIESAGKATPELGRFFTNFLLQVKGAAP